MENVEIIEFDWEMVDGSPIKWGDDDDENGDVDLLNNKDNIIILEE